MSPTTIRLSREEMFQFAVQTTYIPDKQLLDRLEPLFTYLPDQENPVPTTFPGGDMGYIAMIGATGQSYGFEIQLDRVVETLINLRGGIHNLTLQESSNPSDITSIIPFLSGVEIDQKLQEELVSIYTKVSENGNMGKRSIRLPESAIAIVKGESALYPQTFLRMNEYEQEVAVIVYHQSYMNRQNRLFSEHLIKENIVSLFEGYESSYLYDAFSEMSDLCFFSSIEEQSKKLPIYTVSFTSDIHFEIIEE